MPDPRTPQPDSTSAAKNDRPDDGRQETEAERADRNWNDLLQEFRVLQTGVQILGGFLLTLPFQSRFDDLDGSQEKFYLALVLLATSCTVCLLAPIAVHRRIFRWHRKDRLVLVGHRMAQLDLALIGLLVAGMASFVFDVVVDRAAALFVGGAMLLLVTLALVAVPLVVSGPSPTRHRP